MKLKIEKKKFHDILSQLSGVSKFGVLPVLGNVLIKAKDSKLQLTTTDLESRMTCFMDVEIEEEGELTLPVKQLLAFVTKAKGDTVEIIGEIDEDNIPEESIQIKSGKSKLKLIAITAKDFPHIKEFNQEIKFKVVERTILRAFKYTNFSTGKDESKPILTGISLKVSNDNLEVVGTDGKRLGKMSMAITDFEGDDNQYVISSKVIGHLMKLFGDNDNEVEIEFSKNCVKIEVEGKMFMSTLLEGEYPNYEPIIPASFSKQISLPIAELQQSIDVVTIAIDDILNSFVTFIFEDNELKLKAKDTHIGKAEDAIKIEYSGEKLEMNFNPKLMSDVLKNTNDKELVFNANENDSPASIKNNIDYEYIIMPMRITKL